MSGWRGHISYLTERGDVRGEEDFIVRRDTSGRRTMTVSSRICDTDVWRHCILTVDKSFRPIEAYVCVTEQGSDLGAARFKFQDSVASCDVTDANGASTQHLLPLERPALAFGAHPVAADSWHAGALDPAKILVPQRVAPFLVTSTSYNGADGLGLIRNDLNLIVHGRETIDVPAGTFECLHFEIDDSFRPPERRRRYHVWCTADDHRHFVLGRAYGFKPTTYQLDRWENVP